MKKMIVMVVSVLVLAVNGYSYTSLNWGTDGAYVGSGPDLFGTDLNPLTDVTGVGYVLKLYIYTGSGNPMLDANPVVDTLVTQQEFSTSSGDPASGIFLQLVPTIGPAGFNIGSSTIYTAIWDPTGTMYHVLPNTQAIPALIGAPPDPTEINYNAGIQAATAYTVVPEPSTVGLLLVGASLVAFRRFSRR